MSKMENIKTVLCTIEQPERYVVEYFIEKTKKFMLTDNYQEATDFSKIKKVLFFEKIYKNKVEKKLNFNDSPELDHITLRWKNFQLITANFDTKIKIRPRNIIEIIRFIWKEIKNEIIFMMKEIQKEIEEEIYKSEQENKEKQ